MHFLVSGDKDLLTAEYGTVKVRRPQEIIELLASDHEWGTAFVTGRPEEALRQIAAEQHDEVMYAAASASLGGQMPESIEYPAPQQFVEVRGPPGRPDHHARRADHSVGRELLTGEIYLHPSDEAVPVVNPVLPATAGDVCDQEVSAQKFLDHQCCRTALSLRGTLRRPPLAPHGIKIRGVRPPRVPDQRSISVKVEVIKPRMSLVAETGWGRKYRSLSETPWASPVSVRS